MKKQIVCLCLLLFMVLAGKSQEIDLNKPGDLISKDKLLKMSGGFSASTISYSGDEPSARDPFTWYLNGNVNFNILGMVDLPFTFNFTNSGSNYTYPTMPNRFGIHPTYKWLTGHLGDVSMSFSPYTLNGHQFTGVGLDLNPEGPFKIGVMYGRLQKAVGYGEGNSNVQAAYKRMGSGVQVQFEKPKYRLGASFFTARDDKNSLEMPVPDSLMILPQENLAAGINAGFSLIDNMQFTVEYGVSILNRDVRIPDSEYTRTTFDAWKMLLNYTFMNNTVGIGYERIDPGYKTLGAYYFNNDLENITLNYARPFFNNKANIALSGGIERDNLDRSKDQDTRRFVFSADAGYNHSEKLNFSLSYSTFQTYMNLKSQFDYINELSPYDNLDTLNYTQLSQNINFVTNYLLQKDEVRSQNLNFYLSYQESADKQGDMIQEGALSRFYNAALGYGIQFIPQQLNLNASLNFTSNRMENQDLFIVGPTVGLTARFLDKKLSSGLVASYNAGYQSGELQNEVWNLRLNAGYLLMKKHNFSLTTIYRNTLSESAMLKRTNGLTCTAAYSYRF